MSYTQNEKFWEEYTEYLDELTLKNNHKLVLLDEAIQITKANIDLIRQSVDLVEYQRGFKAGLKATKELYEKK